MSASLQVILALLDREFWTEYHDLVDPERMPGPEFAAVVRAITECQAGATRDLILRDVVSALPDNPIYRQLFQQLASIQDHKVPGQVAVRRWLEEAATAEISRAGFEYINSNPLKLKHRDELWAKFQKEVSRFHNLGQRLSDRQHRVEPVSARSLEDFDAVWMERIPFGFAPALDEAMGGGIPIGKLGCIMAPLGVGKSVTLTNVGASAIRRGHDVIHVTLEVDAVTVVIWYHCILTGIPFTTFTRGTKDARRSAIQSAKRIWRDEHPGWGDVRVYDYSGTPISVGGLEGLLGRAGSDLEGSGGDAKVGGARSLFLLDYLALCGGISGGVDAGDGNAALGLAAHQLRGMAVRRELAVVTAHQANREAMRDRRTEIMHSAKSIDIQQAMDYTVTLAQSPDEKAAHLMRVGLAKNRMGFPNVEFRMAQDPTCLRLVEWGEDGYWG